MGGLLLLILAVLAVIFVVSTIKIVNQSHVIMIERLGKFNRELGSGLHIVFPILDRVSHKIDLRTQVLNSDPQPVITKDNVTMKIDTVTYFKITDPFKSVYEIEDYIEAILKITATILRDVIGSLELDETLSSRDQINERLRLGLEEATDRWGVKIERVEVLNIVVPDDIKDAMERQMRAERLKRESILTAEGERQAAILIAQGDKESEILRADADRESKILRAEGDAQAIERLATAKKTEIELVYDALKNAKLDDKILTLKSIEALEKIAQSENKMVVPYEASALMGTVAALKETIEKKEQKFSLESTLGE